MSLYLTVNIFHPFSSFSFVGFKQVKVCWVIINNTNLLPKKKLVFYWKERYQKIIFNVFQINRNLKGILQKCFSFLSLLKYCTNNKRFRSNSFRNTVVSDISRKRQVWTFLSIFLKRNYQENWTHWISNILKIRVIFYKDVRIFWNK